MSCEGPCRSRGALPRSEMIGQHGVQRGNHPPRARDSQRECVRAIPPHLHPALHLMLHPKPSPPACCGRPLPPNVWLRRPCCMCAGSKKPAVRGRCACDPPRWARPHSREAPSPSWWGLSGRVRVSLNAFSRGVAVCAGGGCRWRRDVAMATMRPSAPRRDARRAGLRVSASPGSLRH